jgi:hypothetical protein
MSDEVNFANFLFIFLNIDSFFVKYFWCTKAKALKRSQ